ncbi:hypothetical protein ACNOYE_20300 [Nannocystaceae bacterium ST9]
MSSVRSMFVISGVLAAGCTQVHELGQIDEGGDDAAASTFAGDSSSSDSSSSDSSGDASSSDSSGDASSFDSSGDASDDETTSDETTEGETTDGETDGPIPDACDVVDLGGNDGLTLAIVPMSQWDAGACHEFHVTNETPDDVIWTRDLRFGGTLDNFWNAEGEELSPTDWRFGGQASAGNIVVLSNATIIFGGCMLCSPP